MFGDLTKRVLMVYQADTKQAQANIKQLSLTQKEQAAAMKRDLDAQNAGLESQIAKYATFAAQAAVAYGVIKTGLSSMEFYYERAESRQKAQGQNIEELKRSFRGMVSETELLNLATAANHGVMKLSSDQLVTMTQAMDALGERGHDTAKVMSDFHEFMQTGKAKALKDYGLTIDEARGSAEQLKQVMTQLNVVAREHNANDMEAWDKWARTKTEFKDSVQGLQESLGKLVATLQPILSMIADGWKNIFEVVNLGIEWYEDKLDNFFGTTKMEAEAKRLGELAKVTTEAVNQEIDHMRAAQDAALAETERRIAQTWVSLMTPHWQTRMNAVGEYLGKGLGDGMSKGMMSFLGMLGIDSDKSNDVGASKPKSFGPKIKITFETETPDLEKMKAQREKYVEALKKEYDQQMAESMTEFQGLGFSGQIDPMPAMQSAKELMDSYEQFNNKRSQSAIRSIIGDPEELNLYASGFTMLKDASVAAFQAIMTGSESAGAAMKKVLASQLMQLASSMFGKAIYYAAEAVGYTVMGSWGQAGKAAQAAAMYATGAVALGGIAGKLGGGASAGAGGATAGGSAGPRTLSAAIPSGQVANNGRAVTVVVGDDFADDSPRKRQQKAERMVNLGLRSSQEVVFA